MIHEILGAASLAQGGSLNGSFGGRSINGLTVIGHAAFSADDNITIIRKFLTGGPSEVITNALPLTVLAQLSDLEGGFSAQLTAGIEAANAGEAVNLAAIACARLPLGCLHLQATASELEVVIRKGTTTAAGAVYVGAFWDAQGVDHHFKYVPSMDARDNFRQIDRLWSSSAASLVALTTKIASFQVSTKQQGFVASVPTLMGNTLARAQVEATNGMTLLEVWRSEDELPRSVEAAVNGTDYSNFSWLAREVVYDVSRVSRGTMAQAQAIARELESMPRDTQRALARANIVEKPEVVNARVRAANVG